MTLRAGPGKSAESAVARAPTTTGWQEYRKRVAMAWFLGGWESQNFVANRAMKVNCDYG